MLYNKKDVIKSMRRAMERFLKPEYGDKSIVSMCPSCELESLASNASKYGIGLAEMVPHPTRDYPVMVTLDSRCVKYVKSTGKIIFMGTDGPVVVETRDSRWVVYITNVMCHRGLWLVCNPLANVYVREQLGHPYGL